MQQESLKIPQRINISMPEEFAKRMQHEASKKDVALSSLIRTALKVYTNDDDDCFVELAKHHSGSEAADVASLALRTHQINQSHFLGHVIKEAAHALSRLKDGHDWHDIKCTLPGDAKKLPGEDDPETQEMVRKFFAGLKKESEKTA